MSKSTAANLSLVLAIAMWPIGTLGFFSQLGDFARDTPAFDVWLWRGLYGGGMLTLATACFVAAAWLSGYSFPEARRRALASSLICGSFVVAILWSTVLGPFFAL
jgi:hypothetical protein